MKLGRGSRCIIASLGATGRRSQAEDSFEIGARLGPQCAGRGQHGMAERETPVKSRALVEDSDLYHIGRGEREIQAGLDHAPGGRVI